MKVILWLSQEEVHKKIDYSLICETMCSATWNTGKRKRLMKQFFTESEMVIPGTDPGHVWHRKDPA